MNLPFDPLAVAQLAPLTLMVAVAVLSWDILLAGWMAAQRQAPRVFTQLTSLCGLLVAPAVVVAIASGTESGARTVSGIAWLLPAVCFAFVLQVFYAMSVRLVSPVVAAPILVYNIVLAAVATGDFLVTWHGSAPLVLQAAVAARDTLVGMTVGRASLVSPFAILVPIIAPAYPARWRLTALTRAVLVLAAATVTTLLVIEWPRGVAAVRSYERAARVPMQARPRGDFAMGMRFLPVLGGPPPARAVKADRTLVEQYAPDVLLVVLDEDGTRGPALDSLARVLEPMRADSTRSGSLSGTRNDTRIAVALHHGRQPAPADDPARLAALERVLRRLRPDVLFPAIDDPIPAVLPSRAPSVSWWRLLIRTSSTLRDRVRPATRIGIALSHLDTRDSAIYAMAMENAQVSVVGAAIYPSFSGLPGIDARLRALDRWHAQITTKFATQRATQLASQLASQLATQRAAQDRVPPTTTTWLVNVGGLPHAHGDASQLAAMRQSLAWGSRRAWVSAVILGEPADYDGPFGIRSANGRIRMAWAPLAAAARAMRDVQSDVPNSVSNSVPNGVPNTVPDSVTNNEPR